MSSTIDEVTDLILKAVTEGVNPFLGTKMDPLDFYLDKPTDELLGKHVGFVAHESRCVVDVLPMDDAIKMVIRVSLIKSDRTILRHMHDDVYKGNNADPSGRRFTGVMEIDSDHYDETVNNYAVCPLFYIGKPDIINILGVNPEDPMTRIKELNHFITIF